MPAISTFVHSSRDSANGSAGAQGPKRAVLISKLSYSSALALLARWITNNNRVAQLPRHLPSSEAR